MFIIILDKLSKTSASKILPFNILQLNMQTFAIRALLRFQPNSEKNNNKSGFDFSEHAGFVSSMWEFYCAKFKVYYIPGTSQVTCATSQATQDSFTCNLCSYLSEQNISNSLTFYPCCVQNIRMWNIVWSCWAGHYFASSIFYFSS